MQYNILAGQNLTEQILHVKLIRFGILFGEYNAERFPAYIKIYSGIYSYEEKHQLLLQLGIFEQRRFL